MTATRVAVVTGGNKGIGYAIVKGLCRQFEGIIYLTARSAELGQKAIGEIQADTKDTKTCKELCFHQLDVCSDASVQQFKQHLQTKHQGLDILINNAGMEDMMTGVFNPEWAVQCIETNFFGAMRLSDALIPLLRPHGRVINLGSLIGMLRAWPDGIPKKTMANPNITREELIGVANDFIAHAKKGDHMQNGYPMFGYIVSKSLDHVLSIVQQRELDKLNKDLLANAASPGYVATDLNRNRGVMTPEQGAAGVIKLALLPPNTKEPRGKFLSHDGKELDHTGTTPELDAMLERVAKEIAEKQKQKQ